MTASDDGAIGREVRLRSYPSGTVGRDDFHVVGVPLGTPAPGEVLVRNTWTSVDPGMRLRLSQDAPAGYFSAFPLHRAMDGIMTVGQVVDSRADGFAVGDVVSHAQGWRDYAIVEAGAEQLSGLGTLTKLDVTSAQPQWYLGPLGGMGLTAYAGLSVVGALAGGETVWVSAAAGAVGSLAAQVAKLSGNRVVASAGSDAKVSWLLDEVDVDAAFNYRTVRPVEALAALAPEGIDVYFDSVGGEHLEAALTHLRPNGRVALCGAISEYESGPAGPRNLFLAVSKDLHLVGFRGSSHLHLMPQMQARMSAWLDTGEIQHQESVFQGLEAAPQALVEMLAGRTTGKTLVGLG